MTPRPGKHPRNGPGRTLAGGSLAEGHYPHQRPGRDCTGAHATTARAGRGASGRATLSPLHLDLDRFQMNRAGPVSRGRAEEGDEVEVMLDFLDGILGSRWWDLLIVKLGAGALVLAVIT